jgi:hypothetical protein
MMAMGNWEFYDEFDEVEHDEQEPSFSLHDFKKWLESHKTENEPLSLRESVEEKKSNHDNQNKELLKEQFKQKMRDKVRKNIERKLVERKKKKQ